MKALLLQEDIRKLIPHRYPILLVEEVLAYEPRTSITAYAYVGSEDEVFRGHFPGFPIMPGVYLVEALAQAGAVLQTLDALNWSKGMSIDPNITATDQIGVLGNGKVRFRQPVFPGTQLYLEAKVEQHFSHALFLQVKAYNDDNVFLTGSISITQVSRKKLSKNSEYEQVY